MADTAIYLRSGTTALILDMIEDGFLTECPFYCKKDETKVKILHDFSQDSTLREPAKFDSGAWAHRTARARLNALGVAVP